MAPMEQLGKNLKDELVSNNGLTVGTLFLLFKSELEGLRRAQELQIKAISELFASQIEAMLRMLDERYGTQTKALDAAFSAASLGVSTALLSAKDATTKAEFNADRRFELFRLETQAGLKIVSDKYDGEVTRIFKQLGDLTSRFDQNQGQDVGTASTRNTARLDMGQLLVIVGLVVTCTVAITELVFK